MDEIITTRLWDAVTLVEIRFFDHLIIGDRCCVSLAEKGPFRDRPARNTLIRLRKDPGP